MTDPTTHYASAVVEGTIHAGPDVRAAAHRHLDDLEHGPARGLSWDPTRAARVYAFFECLRLADGEHSGRPFVLHPAQQFIVGALFGWISADGYRRFRNAYVEMAKGNGKTPLAAGIALYLLVADGESGAEIYSAAVTRDQAKICFRDARLFSEGSPALLRRLEVHENNIAFPATHSFMRPLSSEGRSLDGKRVAGAIIDEVHEHPTSIVVDKMRAGTKGRRQALIFEITNSGYDRESVCWEHHEYSRQVLSGAVENDAWFAYMAGLDPGDDWLHDESCWIKANPLLDVSVTSKYLREQVTEARDMPSKRNIVARLNFCVWTEQNIAWLNMERWRGLPADDVDVTGLPCFAGLDLASVKDITAFVLLFPPIEPGQTWVVRGHYWVPEATLREVDQAGRFPYRRWADEGWLRVTDGNVVDYDQVRADINGIAETILIQEIGYDPWNATQIVTQLQGDGFSMTQVRQGFASMHGPCKQLESLITGGQINVGTDPVLRWMAGNVQIKSDPAGNMKPDRGASSAKIDGIVATLIALHRAMAAEVTGPSVYESRGVLIA